jgi:hypothetical protein
LFGKTKDKDSFLKSGLLVAPIGIGQKVAVEENIRLQYIPSELDNITWNLSRAGTEAGNVLL